MTREQGFQRTTPNTRSAPAKSAEEIAEAKRIEKMKTVCSSHHVAGTSERPVTEPAPATRPQ